MKREQLHLDQVDHAAKRRRARAAGPAPTGIWIATGLASSRSRISSNVPSKSAPSRSILLMNASRGTLVLVGLPPDRFALGLDPFAGAEHDHAAVEHAQAALDLGREIDVAGRVDQVDRRTSFQGNVHAGRVDRDAALLLLGIEVGGRWCPCRRRPCGALAPL